MTISWEEKLVYGIVQVVCHCDQKIR